MKKIVFVCALIMFLTVALGTQFLSAYGATPAVLPEATAENPVINYCNKMRSAISSMADILYFSYGFWEDEKKITVSFDLYANGKLDESSIAFPGKAITDKPLRNLAILTLRKTFAVYRNPLPKEMQVGKKKRFTITLLFKKFVREEAANPSPSSIGVVAGDINDDIRAIYGLNLQEGVFVVKVFDNSPAKNAGIKNYDVISAANGTPIKTIADFSKFLEKNPGDIKVTTNSGDFLVKR